MLRSLLIYLSTAAWLRKIVTSWPLAWRAASRFVAGEHLEDALRAVQELNAHGIMATLDHLGENTTTAEEADAALTDIFRILDAIEQAGVKSNLSMKLSQIGLSLDEESCVERLQRVLAYARQRNTFVRIDMEDSLYVEATLRTYHRMRQDGYDNTGVVIQSYLFRSAEDVSKLSGMGAFVRLVKGAYKEPPEVAFPKKKDVDASYDHLIDLLCQSALDAGGPQASPDGKIPPLLAVGSHDPARIAHAKVKAAELGLPKQAIEFQMLYGIRRDLQAQLAAEGYPVRVYVPYGAEWYPYFVRRLAERPANLWFFISNLFRH